MDNTIAFLSCAIMGFTNKLNEIAHKNRKLLFISLNNKGSKCSQFNHNSGHSEKIKGS
jgi:hypothetical protein